MHLVQQDINNLRIKGVITNMDKRHLFIITGPSGSGKNTLLKAIMETLPDFLRIPTVTTRPPRPGEIDGVDHFFNSTDEFERLILADEFVEWQPMFGYMYGTLKNTIRNVINVDKNSFMEIDILGALSIKKMYPDKVVVFFVKPPSLDILEERIMGRGHHISEEELANRLNRAKMEMSYAKQCDHIIINDNLVLAITDLTSIVQSYLGEKVYGKQ